MLSELEMPHPAAELRSLGACRATRFSDEGEPFIVDDQVADEVPVAMVYNGISHAVMLASPSDLEDFARGFSLTEGIVTSAEEIRDIEPVETCNGIELRIEIAASRIAALKERRRALAGRTGCGLCGVESLAQAVQPIRDVATGGRLSAGAVDLAFSQLDQRQGLHRATGATHAAGFADWCGELQLIREDVGRHNALDKLAGAMAAGRIDGTGGFLLVTSRASYEMVHKTAAIGVRALAALAAPTTMAIQAAERSGLTLIGFARRRARMVYAHPGRLAPSAD
ncbi:formate dehydrogenase formation protein [Burkholderiales bacterium 8X]|nr:formate dehydrogenase formation protein [Burkholderiales bacterium 8X]